MSEDQLSLPTQKPDLRQILQLPPPRIWTRKHLREFLGVSNSWIYHRTRPDDADPIPRLTTSTRVRFDTWNEAFLLWMQRHLATPAFEPTTVEDISQPPSPIRQMVTHRRLQVRRRTHQRGCVKMKNGHWTLRYREFNHATGQWKTRRLILDNCKTRIEALKAATPIMVEVNEINNTGSDKPEQLLSFKEFVVAFWKPYAVQKRHEISTLDHRNWMLEVHLLPYFGSKLMRDIRPSDISKFMLSKSTDKANYSANTLSAFYAALRVIFDLAQQNDVIDKSPVRPKLHKPESAKVEKPVLTVMQIRDVLANLNDPQERLLMLLLAVTGMRIGEGLALRWMDFNAESCQLSINHTLYKGKLKEPKTKGSKARLLLTARMAGLLLAHQDSSSHPEAHHYIFCRKKGEPLEASSLRNHLYEAMEKAGIEVVKGKYGPHIFRHSAGTLLYEKSRDLKLVQGALRHSDISTTSDIYVHLGDKVLGEGSEILDAEIIGVVEQEGQSSPDSELASALNAGDLTQEPAALNAGQSEALVIQADQSETEAAALNAGEQEQEPTAFNAGEIVDESSATVADQSETEAAAFNAGVPENQQ
jgi:integrase